VIIEYNRPGTIDDALKLLARQSPLTLPLAGGTVLNLSSPPDCAVVDLQDLGLDKIGEKGGSLSVGAMTTLQTMVEHASQHKNGIFPILKRVVEHESSYNSRQCATLGGIAASAGGRSPLLTTLLALDCQLTLLPGDDGVSLGELLPLRKEKLAGKLITELAIPYKVSLAFEYVARTPADRPIVCAAVAQWPSGRIRVVLGGYGKTPLMIVDGPQEEGVVEAARDAYSGAEDQWASAEYRQETAGVLTRRCLEALASA
jgi:putative selenate reductase FAD-binding subunit